jgi:hypothetical protein
MSFARAGENTSTSPASSVDLITDPDDQWRDYLICGAVAWRAVGLSAFNSVPADGTAR